MTKLPGSGVLEGTLFFNAKYMTVSWYPFAVNDDPSDGTFVIDKKFPLPYTLPLDFNEVTVITRAAKAAELKALEDYQAKVKAIQDALAQFLAIEGPTE